MKYRHLRSLNKNDLNPCSHIRILFNIQKRFIDEEITFFGLADFPEGTSPKAPYLKIVTPSLWRFASAFINFSITLTSFKKNMCTAGSTALKENPSTTLISISSHFVTHCFPLDNFLLALLFDDQTG